MRKISERRSKHERLSECHLAFLAKQRDTARINSEGAFSTGLEVSRSTRETNRYHSRLRTTSVISIHLSSLLSKMNFVIPLLIADVFIIPSHHGLP